MAKDYWRLRLKELRERRGLSQVELSKISGVSQGQINMLEHGKRPFTQKVLDRLLKALKADYNDLFCDIDVLEIFELITVPRRKNDPPEQDFSRLRKIPECVAKKIQKMAFTPRDSS